MSDAEIEVSNNGRNGGDGEEGVDGIMEEDEAEAEEEDDDNADGVDDENDEDASSGEESGSEGGEGEGSDDGESVDDGGSEEEGGGEGEESGEENNDAPARAFIAPITDARVINVELSSIGPHLICSICKGYLRDAHTLTECLHTFCRNCLENFISDHWDEHGVGCPTTGCATRMTSRDPLRTDSRYDRTIQSLVDKILPQFSVFEDNFKKELFEKYRPISSKRKRNILSAPENQSSINQRKLRKYDESNAFLILFELQPWTPPSSDNNNNNNRSKKILPVLDKPIIKTSARATVKTLRKFIIETLKLNTLSNNNTTGLSSLSSSSLPLIDILCDGEVLGSDHSLDFIQRTRWQNGESHLILQYRIGNESL